MADERKCYAGDLTSDTVGKTIRVEAGTPEARTVYTDVLERVEHRKTVEGTKTRVFLSKTKFLPALFGSADLGLELDHTTIVEVLP